MTGKLGPIEVWLNWTKSQMTIRVRYVRDDESATDAEAESVSMRGAQREITAQMIERGYNPVGRWVSELDDIDGTSLESYRVFRPKADAQPI